MSNTKKSLTIANASHEFNEIRRKLNPKNPQAAKHQIKLRKCLDEICNRYGLRFEFMEKLLLNRNYR